MKLAALARKVIIESEEGGEALETDKKMTEKTLDDVFTLNDRGLKYVKLQLEKLNKKAVRIGVAPLELKIVKEGSYKWSDPDTKREVVIRTHDVKIEGKPPIIDGYEFIASIEHSSAGNIINVSPNSSIKELPAEYRTANTDCDYCHTKRDRLNTFVLLKKDSGDLNKVGRSCLKNFLPGKNPLAILKWAEILEAVLGSLVGGEDMDASDDRERGEGGGWSKYYDADEFLIYICMAYILNGYRYTSGKVAREHPGMDSTANFATALMNFKWQEDDWKHTWSRKIENTMTKAEALAKEVAEWKDTKDWDAEIAAKPDMATYFHNMKVIANSPAIQYKNAGYHASLLAIYAREKDWKERQLVDKEKAKTKTYIGKVGEKITFTAVLKRVRDWDTDWGVTYMYAFSEVGTENEIVYFATRSLGIQEGKTYKVTGTVKKLQLSKFNQAPQTIITRGKAELVGGDAKAEAPVVPQDQWGKDLKVDPQGNPLPRNP